MHVSQTARSFAVRLAYLGPVALLLVLWLLNSYRAGGYEARNWLPLALLAGLAGLVVAAFRAYRSPPPGRVLLVLGFFFLYALWSALSSVWAIGPALAWEEATRTGFYLVFFAVAVTYVGRGGAGAGTGQRTLLLVAALVIVILAVVRLSVGTAVGIDFFLARRLSFPITYPNGAGAFYLLLAWPLLWLAADPRGRLWVRALSLATLPVLVQLGLLTQSRGAAVAFVAAGVLYFLLSPARVRSLVFLLVPAVLVGLSFTPLTDYYAAGAHQVAGNVAVLWMVGSWVAAAVAGLLLSLADRRLSVPRTVRLVVSLFLVVCLLAGIVVGLFALRDRVGDLSDWAAGVVDRFVSDAGGTEEGGLGASRFGDMGGNGRWIMWTTAWRGFQDSPAIGNGAGSYRYFNELYRENHSVNVRQAHSIELDALSETGVIGLVLLIGTLGCALGVALAPRFGSWWALARRRRSLLLPLDGPDRPAGAESRGAETRAARPAATGPDDAGPLDAGRRDAGGARQAWIVALVAAFLFWFIQASVDWTWHFPGVTLGALLLLAFALPTSDPPAGAGGHERSPRSSRLLFRLGLGLASLAVLVAAGMPYLAMQYQNVAMAKMSRDTRAALSDASTAESLFPVSAKPLLVRSDIYRAAAGEAVAVADPAQRSYRMAAGLALALVAAERAIEKDAASALVHHGAGLAALDLLAARDPSAVHGSRAQRWAGLAETSAMSDTAAVERSVRALAASESEAQAAIRLLALANDGLVARATAHLRAAQERNPLEPRVKRLLESLGL